MSKYRRWERPEQSVPEWVIGREGMRSVRPSLGGLRCEECLDAVSHVQFVQSGGLCVRCWSMVQASMMGKEQGNAVVVVVDGGMC